MSRAVWFVVFAIGCGRISFADQDAGASPFIVQTRAPGYVNATNLPVPITVAAGNLLAVAVYWHTSTNTVAVTDSLGLTFRNLPTWDASASCGGLGTQVRLWYAAIEVSVNDTVTVVQAPAAGPIGAFLVELSNIDLADPLEGSSGAAAPAATNLMTVPALQIKRPSSILALFNDTSGSGSMANDSAYMALARDVGFYSMLESASVTPGSYTPDASLPMGRMDTCWAATAAAFAAK